LFISPKTASVHVSNILGKLGAATRTEAAAKAHALRLFDAPDGPGALFGRLAAEQQPRELAAAGEQLIQCGR